MAHILLVSAGVVFALWFIVLASGSAAGTAWTLFALSVVLFGIWLIATSMGRRVTP
jgi:hypothetical protein